MTSTPTPQPASETLVICRLRTPRVATGIGTVLPFEHLEVDLDGRPYELYGRVTVVADRVTWRITAIEVDAADGRSTIRFLRDTPVFVALASAIHQQCGADISDRLNAVVEECGGYEILHGEAMPANRFARGLRHNAELDRIFWLDAA